ncbi:MAG: tetratricopeptide repeat protein [Verrucomicrobia bacterium]|nr:tetratricopeptide repeat protein [Verrucomicrobiota bacterium]
MRSYAQSQIFSEKEKAITLESIFSSFILESKSCFRFYAYFHVLFISFLSIQLLSFLLFFSYFTKSMACASALALFFLTLFSYFVLLFFFQTKKPEQFLSIQNTFLQAYRSIHPHSTSLQIAQATLQAIDLLSQEEYRFYKIEPFLLALTSLVGKCKIRLYWKNFHAMKESFYSLGIEQIIDHIKKSPLDLEAHALLAEIYLEHSKLYLPPPSSFLPWIPPEYFSPLFHQRFFACSTRAVEECLVLQEYEEKNTWLFTKLAEIYQLQENAEQEIQCREELRSFAENDPELLFRLGVLYFKQGHNTKGLKIYEELQKDFPKEASLLIEHYPFSPFEEKADL